MKVLQIYEIWYSELLDCWSKWQPENFQIIDKCHHLIEHVSNLVKIEALISLLDQIGLISTGVEFWYLVYSILNKI